MQKRIIGDCVLYLADCFDVLPQLDPVDHVIADPPYEAILHQSMKNGLIRTDGGNSGEGLNFESIDAIRQPAAEQMARLSNGWVLIFCTIEGVTRWADVINAMDGIKYKRAMPWIKPDSAPQMNGQGPAACCEMIVASWAGSGHASWNSGGKRGYYEHLVNPKDRLKKKNAQGKTVALHPTEKPLDLMKELLMDFTQPGQTILDPFMGIGSTGVAAVRLGRRFIGIERDEMYFEAACKRIEQAHEHVDPFVQPTGSIKAKQQSLFSKAMLT